tara:strand:- start:124 stop:435 length:312 start_codon:yes stop_codon:yes gene_type:complete
VAAHHAGYVGSVHQLQPTAWLGEAEGVAGARGVASVCVASEEKAASRDCQQLLPKLLRGAAILDLDHALACRLHILRLGQRVDQGTRVGGADENEQLAMVRGQ